jgi:fumarate reductase flavoprotein subunit
VEFTTSFEEIRERILTANTPHVDAISGATSQSEAVKKAVSKAMLKSSKALARKRAAMTRRRKAMTWWWSAAAAPVWRQPFRRTTKAPAC